MTIQRVDVGVKGIAELIDGGLPEGSPILISGSPGTGKTIFGLQFLIAGLKNNEPGLYITFEEPRESIITTAEAFGWDLGKYIDAKKFDILEYFELGNETYLQELDKLKKNIKDLEEKRGRIVDNPEKNEEIDILMADYQNRISQIEDIITERRYKLTQHEREHEFMEKLRNEVNKMKAKRLVIDSLSAYTIYDESRESLHRFVRRIRDLGTTSLLISELPKDNKGLSRDGVSEFVCDGVILFIVENTRDGLYRKIRVEKMRHTPIDGKEKFIWFTPKGLEMMDRPQDL